MSQRYTETCLLFEDRRAPSLSVVVVCLKVASYTKAAHEFRGVSHRVAPVLLHIWQKREHIWSCFRLRGALAVIISLLHIDRVLRDLKFGQRDQEKTQPWYFSIIVLSHWQRDAGCSPNETRGTERRLNHKVGVCLMGVNSSKEDSRGSKQH